MHAHLQHLLAFAALLAVLDAKEIWDALKACGIGTKEIEWHTGLDRRQFARQLDGPEHLRHSTLQKFPLSFAKEYHWRMVLKVGLPERVLKSLPLLLALPEKPMAKMNVVDERKEQAS